MTQKSVYAIIFTLSASFASAQEAVDSLDVEELHEIVVEAPKVIRKSDMEVYYPSSSAVANSKNGVQLLKNLMIPSVSVTDALGTIKAAGESVQVRINGRSATFEQVNALTPESIKRVEWIDNPGLRYGGASYVLNFIVANPALGGSLQTEAMPALTAAFGKYFADLKLNNGPSQWSVGGFYKLTNKINAHRDYSETFTYTDGTQLSRIESPEGGSVDNTTGNAWLSYNYIKPDTTILYVSLGAYRIFSNAERYRGLMTLSDGSPDFLLYQGYNKNGTNPSFSVYLEQHFAHKQTFVLDLATSLYFGRSASDYTEQLPGVSQSATDVHTLIKDRNQAYAVEAIYIKDWSKSRLTAGASFTANRNRSKYDNLYGSVFHQQQDKTYFFAEYFHRVGKFALTAGLGAQYTRIFFKETEQGNKTWNVRPQATVAYTINNNHRLRLSYNSWQSTPSLSQTNIAPQQIDGFQWQTGNPELKPATSHMLTLRYNFSIPRIDATFGIRAFTSPNAITPLLYWDDDRLVTTYENSRGLRNLSFFFSPQIQIIPDWLMASLYLQYRMERMRGADYKLHNYNWSGDFNLMLSHWGFNLTFQYQLAQHNLWGEQISWGENITLLDLTYNRGHWQFGAGMLMPFGRYDQGSKMLSRWNTNEKHMRVDIRMPYIRVCYNIQWGRQKQSAQKMINADASVDSSKAAGR